ncbi:MAG: nickel pincer cofactor biosynthesis protein LarC [Candidatus Eisenbacteria bacterium]|nr:nickel pincer cofactor biosynthesis protein LarC [Candidatus Eisenbacteria bacterium]
MRALYFDCFSGVSGDMILGALVELGAPVEILIDGLKMMGVEGVGIEKEKIVRGGLPGTKIRIDAPETGEGRDLKEILSIIERSGLPSGVKQDSREVFNLLGEVEGRIHGIEPSRVHFHELGGLDSIIDVVGAMLFVRSLAVETVFSSALPLGSGFVSTAHGRLPVPAPATAALLEGIPVAFCESECELVTPTGISILRKLVKRWGDSPTIRIEKVGYGAGESERKTAPNLLRVFLGELEDVQERKTISVLETNIDDMNPQLYGHLVEVLIEKGARDVFLTQVLMKKGRPGILLTVLCDEGKEKSLVDFMFRETTTLGIRMRREERAELERQIIFVDTEFGKIRVKIARRPGGEVTAHPEFEDCLKAAQEHGLSFLAIHETVRARAMRLSGR